MSLDRPTLKRRLRTAIIALLASYLTYAAFVWAVGTYYLPEGRGWILSMLWAGIGALALGAALGCAIGWLIYRNSARGWRFSMRDLFIAIALAASTLWYVVYTLKK